MKASNLSLVMTAAIGLGAPDASAAKGKVAVLNCTGDKVRLCAYNSYDTAQTFDRSSVVLEQREHATLICDTDNTCRVAPIASFQNCSSTTTKNVSSTLGERAYWMKKGSGGAYNFEKASDDRSYFDKAENQTCPGSPPDLGFTFWNCTQAKFNVCVYNGSKLQSSSIVYTNDRLILYCGNPNTCEVILSKSCPNERPKGVYHTLRETAAYWIIDRGGFAGLGFKRAGELNYFQIGANRICPAKTNK